LCSIIHRKTRHPDPLLLRYRVSGLRLLLKRRLTLSENGNVPRNEAILRTFSMVVALDIKLNHGTHSKQISLLLR
jgi:hypothetical protein